MSEEETSSKRIRLLTLRNEAWKMPNILVRSVNLVESAMLGRSGTLRPARPITGSDLPEGEEKNSRTDQDSSPPTHGRQTLATVIEGWLDLVGHPLVNRDQVV